MVTQLNPWSTGFYYNHYFYANDDHAEDLFCLLHMKEKAEWMNDPFWTDYLARRDHTCQSQLERVSFRKISKLPLKDSKWCQSCCPLHLLQRSLTLTTMILSEINVSSMSYSLSDLFLEAWKSMINAWIHCSVNMPTDGSFAKSSASPELLCFRHWWVSEGVREILSPFCKGTYWCLGFLFILLLLLGWFGLLGFFSFVLWVWGFFFVCFLGWKNQTYQKEKSKI